MCIVVIEDEPDLRVMLQDLLESSGFDTVALSRPECVNTISEKPDVFLIDMMLPGQNGIELAGQLRDHGYRDTPMIAMSASQIMLELASESRLFQSILLKPFDVTKLLDCIEQLAS